MKICENRNSYNRFCKVCPTTEISCKKAEELLKEIMKNDKWKDKLKPIVTAYDKNPNGVADY